MKSVLASVLADCAEIVGLIDAGWSAWEKNNFRPSRDDNDPIAHWEGCDVIVRSDDGGKWFLDEGDKWEKLVE
jgi:hypothetical protein